MINGNYRIRYLPLFYEDMHSIVSYIKNELSKVFNRNDKKINEIGQLYDTVRSWSCLFILAKKDQRRI